MKLSHIISLSCISMSAFCCQKQNQLGLRSLSEVGLPPILQQREIKGLHAGHQILGIGLFRQAMRNPEFRSYAQQRFQSDVQEGVNYLLGHSKTPECLSEEGRIPESSIIREGVVGSCSLHFYKGKFNISRNGRMRRVPPCDTDPELRQLDEKTIHNYLSVANILMKRCNDGSVVLRSHVGGKGGAWQVFAYEGLMWFMSTAGRLLTQFTITQAVRSMAETAQREAPRVAQTVANRVADAMPGALRTGVLYAGEHTYNIVTQASNGSYYYWQAVMRDGVQYIVENNPRTLMTSFAEGIRSLPQNPLAQRIGVSAIAGAAYDAISESVTPAPSTVVSGFMDAVIDHAPQLSQETATTWLLNYASGMWNIGFTWPL